MSITGNGTAVPSTAVPGMKLIDMNTKFTPTEIEREMDLVDHVGVSTAAWGRRRRQDRRRRRGGSTIGEDTGACGGRGGAPAMVMHADGEGSDGGSPDGEGHRRRGTGDGGARRWRGLTAAGRQRQAVEWGGATATAGSGWWGEGGRWGGEGQR
jgi:hypothetical protein